MKTTKRIISILLCAAMLMALLCACGTAAQEDAAPQNDTPKNEVSEQTPEPPIEQAEETQMAEQQQETEAEQVEKRVITPPESIDSDPNIVVWRMPGYQAVTLQDRVETLNQFLADKGAEYTVRVEGYAGDTAIRTQTVTDALAEIWESGEQADVISVESSGVLSFEGENGKIVFKYTAAYADAVALDMLAPMDEYLNSDKGQTLKAAILPENLTACEIDGSIYGIGQTSHVIKGTAYNKDLLEKYNIDPVSLSTDVFKNASVFERVIEGEGNDVRFAPYWADLSDYAAGIPVPLECHAVSFDTESDCFVNKYGTVDYGEYVNKIYDFKSKGIAKTFFQNVDSFFAVEISDVKRTDIYEDTYVYANTKNNSVKQKVIIVPDINQPMYQLSRDGYRTGIASWSQNQENAFDFLTRLFTDPDIANLVQYGIEGIDYDFQNGRVVGTDPESYYDTFQVLTNEMITYPMVSDSEDKLAFETEYSAAISDSVPTGFRFNGTSVGKELCDIKLYYLMGDQTNLPITRLEAKDVHSALGELSDKMNELGLQKVLDEINRQYEQWKTEVD